MSLLSSVCQISETQIM